MVALQLRNPRSKKFAQIVQIYGREVRDDQVGSGPLQNGATTIFGDGQTFHSGCFGWLPRHRSPHLRIPECCKPFSYVITGYDCVK